MTDEDWYKFWRDALAGKKPGMSESFPQCGFYRWPKKSSYGARKTFQAVAYWRVGNTMHCKVDDEDKEPQYGADIWISVGSYPVSYENYQGYMETGRWQDEHELVTMGSNQPPDDDSYEGLKAAIEDLAREANKLIIDDKVAQTQAEVDQLGNLADRIAELGRKAEHKLKTEKTPHKDAIDAAEAKWKPLVITSQVYKALKSRLMLPFMSQEQKRIAAIMEHDCIEPLPRPRAGTRGRAMSLRGTKKAKIIDRDAVLAHFKDNEMVSTTLQVLSDRAVRADVSVPGVEAYFEERVV